MFGTGEISIGTLQSNRVHYSRKILKTDYETGEKSHEHKGMNVLQENFWSPIYIVIEPV